MIRVPDYYFVDLALSDAVDVMTRRGSMDLLKGMEEMQQLWDDYVKSTHTGETLFESDDDFFDVWGYEMSAYNVVFENMSKLFAPKEV